MHIEVQVALNFVISYLYNKLPRRRVNIFGEELEKALKEKFQGHWYPDKPYKGSAFRCLKTGDPIDKVLERAARESGVPIQDILENLPQELAVWVDPGEVSYRIGEKGAVKVLFSDKADPQDEKSADREVTKTFNPEAQCFRPIESVGCGLSNLSLSSPISSSNNSNNKSIMTPFVNNPAVVAQQQQHHHQQQQQQQQQAPPTVPPPMAAVSSATAGVAPPPVSNQVVAVSSANHVGSTAPSPTAHLGAPPYKGSPSPVPSFIPRTTTPLTFTTATFAQTKFGSTKLKTSSKRANRMSPTEFANYIKQRAMQQQMHQQPPHHSPGGGRALSPDPSAYYFSPHGPYGGAPPFPHRSMFESSTAAANQFLSPDLYSGKLPFDHTPLNNPYYPNNNNCNNGSGNNSNSVASATAGVGAPGSAPTTPQDSKLLDNWPYPAAGQYQHLLVAN